MPIEAQIGKLASRGVEIGDATAAVNLLRAVGYYRLTGYLYPFRSSERYDDEGRTRVRVLSGYRKGTTMAHAAKIIDFDRALRILALDGIERVEVSLRMQLGHTLGAKSPFAHPDPATFVPPFTAEYTDPISGLQTSKHLQWIAKANARRDASDEAFVAHFRDKYDGQMPIWALTEILELGHLSRLYGGLNNSLATAIAHYYGAGHGEQDRQLELRPERRRPPRPPVQPKARHRPQPATRRRRPAPGPSSRR
ncbi:Abi family protein [Microbacterium sp. LRZ72]|uniref:Abi family protein n=1 Tax=Microbacterium sp. LRZ72 TaxID=2942481 RepID=UPI0029B1FF0D|nr:Abi family protein [Microbacterium sp. LRZ72]MDX2377694.1 Abi family protein [Microbacterium sp. LRZ72]